MGSHADQLAASAEESVAFNKFPVVSGNQDVKESGSKPPAGEYMRDSDPKVGGSNTQSEQPPAEESSSASQAPSTRPHNREKQSESEAGTEKPKPVYNKPRYLPLKPGHPDHGFYTRVQNPHCGPNVYAEPLGKGFDEFWLARMTGGYVTKPMK